MLDGAASGCEVGPGRGSGLSTGTFPRTASEPAVLGRLGVLLWCLLFSAELHGVEEHADEESEDEQVEDHLRHDGYAGRLAGRADAPKPTVAKTVIVKYSESVRVSEWTLKLSVLAWAIRK